MRLATAMLTGALLVGAAASAQDAKTGPYEPRFSALPDNPCELLSVSQLAEVTGLPVLAARQVPSIAKLVEAQRENRDPDPGTICSYETGTPVGAISIHVPKRQDRTTVQYWDDRAYYFETFPGSAEPLAGVGADAWISGGASIHALVSENEHFTVSVQHYHPDADELLIRVAQRILDRF